MKKSDLKNQMVVECRNGQKYMVVDYIILCNSGFIDLLNFDDKLKYVGFSKLDIMKVYDKIYRLDLLDNPECLALLWERSETKEVTMKEVEEKFGCKVKIVKGWNWLCN